jgi:prophage antirepressor-like protein
MMQNHVTAIALTSFNGEPRLDSRVIAQQLGVKRKVLYLLLKRYRADFHRFGMLRFDQTPIGELTGGARPEKFALLNQAHLERLLTYVDDIPEIQAAGNRLLQAFGDLTLARAEPEQRTQQNGLIPFSFESREIRVVMLEQSPWWIAMDVAGVLEYSDTEAMTRRLDDDEVRNLQIVGFGHGGRGVTVINESGLYSAILGSRKPDAKKFKKWVTSEVLPSIRKTGSYTLPGMQPLPISAKLQFGILRRARALADEAEQTAFESYRQAMQEQARHNPQFRPEDWRPQPALSAKALPSPALETDPAWQIARQSSYRTRNPQRDYEVLKLRLSGMTYREIGYEVGISEIHAWRIVTRQMDKVGAL